MRTFGLTQCHSVLKLEVSPYAGSDYANYTDVLLIFDGLEEAIKNRMRTIYGAFADRPPWPSTTTRSQMLLRFMSNGQNNNFAGFSANITFGKTCQQSQP